VCSAHRIAPELPSFSRGLHQWISSVKSASVRNSSCPCRRLNSDQIGISLRLRAYPGREKPVGLILGGDNRPIFFTTPNCESALSSTAERVDVLSFSWIPFSSDGVILVVA
jgi:hypothetical protein